MNGNRAKNHNLIKMLVICFLGILLNVCGSQLAQGLDLPIYLDVIGTVVVTGLCGYLPGIVVGLFTNLINGFSNTDLFYYAIVNVLVAVITYIFVQKKWLFSVFGFVGLVLILTLLGGVHETLLNWATDPTAFKESGFGKTFMNASWPELIDKPIALGVFLLLHHFLPEHLKEYLHFEGWQQKAMSEEEKHAVESIHNRRISLRTKVTLLLTTVFLAIGSAAMIISVILYRQYCIDEHILLAQGTSQLVAATLDGDKVDMYLTLGEEAPDYGEVEKRLYNIRDNSTDVLYIYVYQIRPDGCHVVFDLDTEELPGAEPGEIIGFDESFSEDLQALLRGESIQPRISNDTYGWLITVYTPIQNKAGETVAYAAADVSMELVSEQQMSFLIKLLSLFMGFFVLAIATGRWISEYNIILPVNAMARSSSAFAYNDEDALEENVESLRELDIHTGDEIENMYQAFTKTTENNANYVNQLRTKTETIAQMQNALIMVLADMVESRDENTGDHVRKTAAYTRIIMDQLKEMGYYTDQLTDKFIYDVEHSAPLHDIGKIAVSDVILNKPGKLTDEEFAIMKTHTTAGADILEQVIDTVPDSGYLKEAKNLAEYHHEKWNGRGYPHGLSGEDIPLSARIMAVADVFDALVSDRCYKKAFSFEKAMSIIQEDAGTHFDPKVVEAFLAAQDKVREVAEHFRSMGGKLYKN
ncbi:MAG: HD domain-containing protein [Eubacterium sp.]|nr:HD domain-containing protein [Eubacterium sp.]